METVTTKAIPAATGRHGDWIQTASGRPFWPFDPRPEEVHIEDIAIHLGKICRFGGACRGFYTVGEHSVRVSRVCSPEDALWGLLHDAPEAYIGDLQRPIKRHDGMGTYRHIEGLIWEAVCERFGLKRTDVAWMHRYAFPDSVKRADEILLATEARDLMGNQCLERWSSIQDIEPLPDPVEPWHRETVGRLFLARFRELTNGR